MKNPFTSDYNKAQTSPSVVNGIILVSQDVPMNNSAIPGACSMGSFLSIESFSLDSSSFNYDLFFNCYNISDNFNIIDGVKNDLRRNDNRQLDLNRHKQSITGLILDYQTILKQLYNRYTDSLYVDLCYIAIGYVKESIALYSIFFALVKERLDSGLRLSVLMRMYLKKIE